MTLARFAIIGSIITDEAMPNLFTICLLPDSVCKIVCQRGNVVVKILQLKHLRIDVAWKLFHNHARKKPPLGLDVLGL